MAKKKYYWKELSQDGLLKEPAEVGRKLFTSCESLNDCNGFGSEDEAVKYLEEMVKKHGLGSFGGVPGSLVLITEYDTHK